MKMKKEYMSPEAGIIAYSTTYIMAGSLEFGGTTGEGGAEEATHEFRGDWSDIWNGM